MGVVRVVTVMAVVRVMPGRARGPVAVGEGEQGIQIGGRVGRDLGDRCLRTTGAEAGVRDLGLRSLGEQRSERDADWDEYRLLFQERTTICVPKCDCQAIQESDPVSLTPRVASGIVIQVFDGQRRVLDAWWR